MKRLAQAMAGIFIFIFSPFILIGFFSCALVLALIFGCVMFKEFIDVVGEKL